MKNLTKLFVAVAALFAGYACTTDAIEDLGVAVEGRTTITLSLEESRTQLGEKADNVYPLYWSVGDQISVNGVVSSALTEGGSANATFTLDGQLTYPYNVIYPASSTNEVTFLATQEYVEGSFALGAAPMYGYAASADDAIQMYHLIGALRLDISGSATLSKLTIEANKGYLAGTYKVDCTTGTLTLAEGTTSRKVTLNFGEGLTLGATATPVYVTVPAGEYGIVDVTLVTTSGEKMAIKFDTSAKPILAGQVREFPSFGFVANVSEDDLFVIDGKDALIAFAANPTKSAILTADIDMTGVAWTPIEGFGQKFDGDNFTIKGLSAPLFGSTAATIKDLKLVDVNIASNERLILGAIACQITHEGSLDNCHATGLITVNNTTATLATDADKYRTICIGGLVGYSAGGSLSNCVNEVNLQINQLVAAGNAVSVNPLIGGILGGAAFTSLSDEIKECAAVVNCVNGAAGKNSGWIKYYDNSANQVLVPNIGGVVGFGFEENNSEIVGCTNYGAIDLNANTAGAYSLGHTSTSIGGIFGYSKATIKDNNNYGPISVSGGKIKTFVLGGVGAVAAPVLFYNNHNHQSANITVSDSATFHSLNVAGVLAAIVGAAEVDTCTNDAPIVVKASAAADIPTHKSGYYRVGGVVTYTNRTIQNCENKANGDITIEGNIKLIRTDAQSGYDVAGVYCYSSTSGEHRNNINRGDINVYTNVELHSGITDATHGRLDIGGVTAHTQIASHSTDLNTGNITIGKANGEEMSITANGIYIGGVTAQRYKRGVDAEAALVNNGNITVNKGVTLSGNGIGVHIGGCSAYNAVTSTYNNFTNTGNITIDGAISDLAYIGGVGGLVLATVANGTQSGNITINGECSKTLNVGGCIGKYTGTAVSDTANSGNVTLNQRNTNTAAVSIAGVVGSTGAASFTNCTNSGIVTESDAVTGCFENYVGGVVGYGGGAITLDNCSNTMKTGSTAEYGIVVNVKQKGGATDSNPMRIGGLIGRCTSTLTMANTNSNSAAIQVKAHYRDTGGLTIGGVTGIISKSSISGTITNSADIYYEGRCPSANFGLGGVFASPAGEIVNATITNTGDLYVVKGEGITDHIPLTSDSKRCCLGGIIGFTTTKLANARFYGNIYIPDWHVGGYGNIFGMIQGASTTDVISNCHCGGNIYREYDEEDEGYKALPISASNYFEYLIGAPMTAADAKAAGCGYISSIDATPVYVTE